MNTCKPNVSLGTTCPTTQTCNQWDVTTSTDSCYLNQLQQESLNIGGAQFNVHKLLGLHEQTRLTDLAGTGTPISAGDAPNTTSASAFDITANTWQSFHSGPAVTSLCYIGYDFGLVRLPNGRIQYGTKAEQKYEITAIRIKQSNVQLNRCTKVRLERSDDGVKWIGVGIANLPDTNKLEFVRFKQSVPSRYWRLRPTAFNGACGNRWEIQALELIQATDTSLQSIQDKVLLENRSREYAQVPTLIKGTYDIVSMPTILAAHGIDMGPDKINIKLNFDACIGAIGRPIIIGDIIEIPSETQYSPQLVAVKKYVEVTDVSWDSSSFTPGWKPTMLAIMAEHAIASEETQDIFGDLSVDQDSAVIGAKKWQDLNEIQESNVTEAVSDVYERGSDASNTFREFTEEEIAQASTEGFSELSKLNARMKGPYVEDAIPPGGLPFTEGTSFPQNPKNGDYHRLTYEGLAKDVPARLYRWSDLKHRWIYLETDKRALFNAQKPILSEFLVSNTKSSGRTLGK